MHRGSLGKGRAGGFTSLGTCVTLPAFAGSAARAGLEAATDLVPHCFGILREVRMRRFAFVSFASWCCPVCRGQPGWEASPSNPRGCVGTGLQTHQPGAGPTQVLHQLFSGLVLCLWEGSTWSLAKHGGRNPMPWGR